MGRGNMVSISSGGRWWVYLAIGATTSSDPGARYEGVSLSSTASRRGKAGSSRTQRPGKLLDFNNMWMTL
eukprot:6151273-Pyramimonas_sp.AAC.2